MSPDPVSRAHQLVSGTIDNLVEIGAFPELTNCQHHHIDDAGHYSAPACALRSR